MMGHHTRSESLFYYFRLEDQVPANHLLRLIDMHIDFSFVREQLKDSYSDTGRPSIDPELLLRIVLIGYLYGISSERKLVEELRMHLAWRWFTGLGFDQEIPHHSTFSKNRHGRFHESKLFGQMFERIVAQCLEVGLVRGDKLSVDGTFVEANASKESRIPREQLAEAAQVNRTVREWLTELEAQNPVEEPTHSQDKVSTTDPDSTYATKGGTPARMGYYNNYLVDNHSCIIVGVQATGARLSEESRAAEEMIARLTQWQGKNPQSIAADASYGNGELLQWLMDRQITPYMPTRDAVARTRSPLFGPERFTYQPESNSYLCPAGQQLNYGGRNDRNRAFAYIGTRPKCGPCPLKSQHQRGISLPRHPYERSRSTTGARPLEYSGVRAGTTAAEESRSAICRTEGTHRPTSPPLAQAEVRSGAVLHGRHSAEHQTPGPILEHAERRAGGGHRLAADSSPAKLLPLSTPA